ncbi:MAG: hypothetical protein AB7S77_11705, partial [Desulfatirhabdiaceae bacterium]
SGYNLSSTKAFYAAEAGMEEARKRLKGIKNVSANPNYVGDPATSPNANWSAFILTSSSWPLTDHPDYNSSLQNYVPTTSSYTSTTVAQNSLQTMMPYMVQIRHKREYDAEVAGHTSSVPHYFDNDGSTTTHSAGSPGNIIYYGYGNSAAPATVVQFTGGTATKPVEIISAYGRVGASKKLIEIEVAYDPGPTIAAAIYAKGDITGNGSALVIDGSDDCGIASSKPPTYTKNPSVTNPNGSPVMVPDPPGPENGTLDIDINSHVDSLKSSASITLTADTNGATYGTSTDFVTVYSDTSNPNNVQGLKLQNVVGYGTLLVEGDLELGGGFEWKGLVLVTGVLTFNGGGAGVNIRGAVLANQTVSINGGLDIKYDSCMVDKALSSQDLKIISWREIY